MDDYDIPFDGMSDDEPKSRAMNGDDPMYMGDTAYYERDYADAGTDDGSEDVAAYWYLSQFGNMLDAADDYKTDPADDPMHYFDDINFNPFS